MGLSKKDARTREQKEKAAKGIKVRLRLPLSLRLPRFPR